MNLSKQKESTRKEIKKIKKNNEVKKIKTVDKLINQNSNSFRKYNENINYSFN